MSTVRFPASLDAELANIATATADLADAVKDVRRDDGALPNGIVTRESLSADVVEHFQGAKGEDGTDGAAATIVVNEVVTRAASPDRARRLQQR